MSDVNGLAAKCSFHNRGVSLRHIAGGMGCDPLQHIDQPDVRVHLVHATRRDKALDDSDMLRAEFRPTEQP